ncbi:MAG: adenylosuccinate lyase [Pseudomonadota bacterium]
MKTKTVLAALALTLAPTLGLAAGCNYGKQEQQAMSCAPGTSFDAATNSCVATTG